MDQFQVETAARYQVRDITGDGKKETFCNIFVSDVTNTLWAEIPHKLNGEWQDVTANAKWLRAGNGGWRVAQPSEAQTAANNGQPAVVVWVSHDGGHGHIAMLRPSLGRGGIWISQAGARRYRDVPLQVGFAGLAPLEFFIHQ
jgi:hypothetical protein